MNLRPIVFAVLLVSFFAVVIVSVVENNRDTSIIKQNCYKTKLLYQTRSGGWSNVYDCSMINYKGEQND